MNIFKSISQFSGLTFISRCFGLIRDWLFARYFGADGLMDAFLIAFKIPNFFRRLFAEGAFSQVFIPIIISSEKQSNQDTSNPLSDNQKQLVAGISARLYSVVLLFCILGMIASPFIVSLFAPGFKEYPVQSLLSADLLRITFPYLFFITIVALLTSLLNISGRFALGAVIPVVLNICFILCVLYFRSIFNPPIIVLAVAVFIAGSLQLLIVMIVAHQRGLLILPRWHISATNQNKLKKMGKMLIPAILSVSVIQINLIVDMLLASTLSQGSISWLYYGQRLMELPNGIFIVAISTVILPTFSYLLQNHSAREFSPHVDRAVLLGIFITLPSMLGLLFLSQEIISLLFQGGAFEQQDVSQSAKALSAYALSLPAFMLIKIYSPCFFAHQNTKTPLICSAFSVIVNVILSLLLIDSFAHVGLAIATSAAAWINALLLYFFLLKQNKIIFFQAKKELLKITTANIIFAYTLYQATHYFSEWQIWSKVQQSVTLLASITLFVGLYLVLSLLLKVNFRQWLDWKKK